MHRKNMQTEKGKTFRSSWALVLVLSCIAYCLGGLAFGWMGCPDVVQSHTFTVCVSWFGWDLIVWPIFFVLTVLTHPLGIVLFSASMASGVWYFFFYEPRRKKLLTE
jgi:Flp pilus assembly protein protease CpaA